MVRALVADDSIEGAAHAYFLAKQGHEAVFYSPNGYVVNEAMKYSHVTSHYLTRQEFTKLVTSNKLMATRELNTEADVLIIPTRTVCNEGEEISRLTALVRRISERVQPAPYTIVVGANALGSTRKIAQVILNYFPEMEPSSVIYVGCPLTVRDKPPLYSDGASRETLTLAKRLYRQDFLNLPSLEQAEYVTLVKMVSRYVTYYLGLQILLSSQKLGVEALDYVAGDTLTLGFENKIVEYTFAYLQRSEKVGSQTSRIVGEAMRCRRRALHEAGRYAKRVLRKLAKERENLRVLAVVDGEREKELVNNLLPARGVKARFRYTGEIPVTEVDEKKLGSNDVVLSVTACPSLSRALAGLGNVYVVDIMRPVKALR